MVEDLIKRLRNWRDTHLSGLAREAADLIEQQSARLTDLESERDHLIATQAACDGGSCEHDGCQRKDLIGYRETAAKWVAEFHAMKKRIYDLESERDALLAAAGKEAVTKLQVMYGPMPESNGKTNWTAILHKGDLEEGHTIDRSEYPDRVRYAADCVRYLIGELQDRPWILDYDADKHSGYTDPTAAPEKGDGRDAWQPIETAPKDGRTVLLGYLNSAGKWRTTRGQWMSEEYIAECWEEPDNVEPGWFETAEEAEDMPNCWRIAPTHWQPLPAPPAALSQKAGEQQ